MGRVADEIAAGLTELAADLEAGRPVPVTVLGRRRGVLMQPSLF